MFQGGDLGCSVCLLELPVCLAQGVIWERVVKVYCIKKKEILRKQYGRWVQIINKQ